MSNPSDFVSFADYLGLNSESGQQMLDRSTVDAEKEFAAAQAANEAHYQIADEAGEGTDAGVYERTGSAARKGLASYGDFMRGMNDPAARQALMEKTYGKGAVSAIDSALVGAAGGGQLASGQKKFLNERTRFEARDMAADERKGRYSTQKADYAAGEAKQREKEQADIDRAEKNRLGKKYWQEMNTAPDSVRHSENWTQRDKDLYMNQLTRGHQDARGQVDWDKLDADWQRSRKTMYENRPRTFWGGEIDVFGPKPQDPSQDTNTWASYYEKHKRQGAK